MDIVAAVLRADFLDGFLSENLQSRFVAWEVPIFHTNMVS